MVPTPSGGAMSLPKIIKPIEIKSKPVAPNATNGNHHESEFYNRQKFKKEFHEKSFSESARFCD